MIREVLVEEKIVGRETTVGILDGVALPVVEVRPESPAVMITGTNTPPATRNIFARRILTRRRRSGFRPRRSARFTRLADAIMRAWT